MKQSGEISGNEKIQIKKKMTEIKHFQSPQDFLIWYELHKDDLKDLKTNSINKLISIPDYKWGVRKYTTDTSH
ncbi:MAG: hypothetical protein Ta2E_00680 [Mycoplasmoidaceae bacterium]|nr:MAG: hypothetical protein Ta2E_00680 [Mycoplasmoidaceae bacterium]